MHHPVSQAVGWRIQANLFAPMDMTALRRAMHCAYDKPSLITLCADLGFDYDDLRGETLEIKLHYLIDRFRRCESLDRLVTHVLNDDLIWPSG